MRRAIEELEGKYRQLQLNRKQEAEIERYSDKYAPAADGTVHLLNSMISRADEYPEELVALGFGHGVKCQARGAKAKLMVTEEIDSEVESSSEVSTPPEDPEYEENDYIEAYHDDDEQESEEDFEDML